ncbi:16S rRNA processing protein RimM [Fontibacillus panacisegetis]|uniref:Ribosome maturation factor RimM n=1 Tax=Fontibacillus panacisegetis TaxID=670482 RepID=A0A1G7F422_9BACL|nr:ribosome maturation factor RimM [Fontibacillus panacisegetis]SDE70649.1 16S rRNA processing protein RimM [Fontibacillus panacisegetis]
MSDSLLTVGKIVNTHGIRGDVKVLLHTDFPEVRFAPKSSLKMIHPENGTQIVVTVASARPYKGMYIVKFNEYNDINVVEKYKGYELKVAKENSVQLPKNEYYFHEIIGCRVVSDEGEELGVIEEILRPGANDVWVVKLPNHKQLLLPVIDDVVLDVDVSAKLVKVHVMEGLL